MSKQSLLLVDGDARSLRVLEVSLRKAGFVVTAALSVQDALDKLDLHAPDLIISETTFPEGDGFELRSRVRATPEWSDIPFIFLTAEAAIENKIRGLELGVDDYLTKPIYIKEIVTRINILLQKRQRARFEERRDGRTRFAGRVQDMPVVDVIQTIEISRKSGVIQFVGERGRQAAIYFRDGRVIDAEAGTLQGEDAVYRLLTWSEGEFEVAFRTVRRREVITMSSQALLMEGMRRLDEWSRLFEQLPPLTHRFEVDTIELAARLGDVPDDNNRILRLFDGKRTLLEVIDASDVGDLECLQAISRLYFEELLIDLDHGKAPRRDTGKSVALVEIGTPTPLDEETSGPSSSEPLAVAASPEATPGGTAEGSGSTAHARADGSGAGESSLGEVGPLMGGYRPSSLRLIDEAVAAAQAIEPSLFDDMVDAPGRQSPGEPRGNGVSRATPGRASEDRARGAPAGSEATSVVAATQPEPSTTAREESGLRMIGSLGRDRAEASGELAPLGQPRPSRSETARELVTILPRRITREVPIVTGELAESTAAPTTAHTPTPPVLASNPVPAPAVEAPAVPPPLVPPPPRLPLPGSGVRAPSFAHRLLRTARSADGKSPRLGALLLIVLAAVLAGAAVLLRLRSHATSQQHAGVIQDAAQPSGTVPSSGAAGSAPDGSEAIEAAGRASASPGDATGADAGVHGADAGVHGADAGVHGADAGVHGADAGVRGADAGVRGADAGVRGADTGLHGADTGSAGLPDKVTEAKILYDKAHDALEDGDFARAFDLADASLKLRKTARTYLLRAQAEQRLERVDAALASVDAAAQIAPDYGAVWETRGRILWAASRRDEARAAFEKFLALEPNSPKAASVQRLMNEPR